MRRVVYDGNGIVLSDTGEAETPPPFRLEPYEFIRLFYYGEEEAIREGAKSDPILNVALGRLDRAKIIVGDNEDVLNFMAYLVVNGYLTQERHDQILSNTKITQV